MPQNKQTKDISTTIVEPDNTFNQVNQFDADYYATANPDVIAAGMTPEQHYQSNGEKEGRKPNAQFDPTFYLKLNPDVRIAKVSPFAHYQSHGYQECRLTLSPLERAERKRNPEQKPLLFIGQGSILPDVEFVLLNVIRWFYENTHRNIHLLLLAPTPAIQHYAQYCHDMYVLADCQVDNSDELKRFLGESFEFTYLNAPIIGNLLNILQTHSTCLNGKIISHIQDLEKVVDIFPEANVASLIKTLQIKQHSLLQQLKKITSECDNMAKKLQEIEATAKTTIDFL